MADFSYGEDIAPMKGEYFGMRPVSTHMSQYLYEQYDRPMMEMQAEERKVQAQELAFQRAQLEFDKAKEESHRQQEEADHLAVVSAQLSENLNSEMSNFDKLNLINQTRQDLYATRPRMAGSTIFKGLFSSATQSVTGTAAQQDYFIPQMTAAAQLGDVKITKELADDDGIRTKKEEGLIKVAEAHANRLTTSYATKQNQALLSALTSDIGLVEKLGGEGELTEAELESGIFDKPFTLNYEERLAMDAVMKRNFPEDYDAYAGGTYPTPADKRQWVLNRLHRKRRALTGIANPAASLPDDNVAGKFSE